MARFQVSISRPGRRYDVVPTRANGRSSANGAAPAKGDTAVGDKWWPSEWGPDDQRGAANRLTPEKVLAAKDLITTGKVYQLGRVYESGMPVFGKDIGPTSVEPVRLVPEKVNQGSFSSRFGLRLEGLPAREALGGQRPRGQRRLLRAARFAAVGAVV